ncbi:MAG TPA: glycosyltransferase family 39 protein [Pirellulales bacterium]
MIAEIGSNLPSVPSPVYRAGTNGRAQLLALFGALTSLVFVSQGWRGAFTGLDYDQVINTDEARQLLDDGRLPQVGALASVGSYNPPGTAWLIVPGMLTKNPQFYERIGAVGLGALTLLGLWLLTRTCADDRTAALVVILYAFSALGLFFATSLWPRAKPGAYVWMAYFILLWATRRQSRYLAASLIVYSLGLLVFLEMAPALLAILLVWLVYRPPVRVGAVAIAALVSGVIWAPHLAFEARRNFSDLTGQVLLVNLFPDTNSHLAAYGEALGTWNASQHALGDFAPKVSEVPPGSWGQKAKKLFFRGFHFVQNLVALLLYENPLGLIAIPIFLLPLVAWGSRICHLPQRMQSRREISWLGMVVLVMAVIANQKTAEMLMGRSLDGGEAAKIWLVEGVIALVGIALVCRKLTARSLNCVERFFAPVSTPQDAQALQIVFLCFVGPWLGLSLVAGLVKYCWWLWGLQVVMLGVGASYIPRRCGWPHWSVVLVETLAVVSIVCNAATFHRAGAWRMDGLAGAVPPIVQAADALAEQFQAADHSPDVPIGYQLFFNGYELLGHGLDTRYKIGAPLDQYFAERYGIINQRDNAEGFSGDDLYRIVETVPRPSKLNRFRFNDAAEFERLKQFDHYQLWKRKVAPLGADAATPAKSAP